MKQNPYIRGFMKAFPFVRTDAGGPTAVLNCGKYPYNITEVRWALTLAVNVTELVIMGWHAQVALASLFIFRGLGISLCLMGISHSMRQYHTN